MEISSFSWIVEENKAYKAVDKSTINYNSTGIPKRIRSFWDAENMPDGTRKYITLIVDLKGFSAVIEQKRGRTSLHWNSDLKNAIGLCDKKNLVQSNVGSGKTFNILNLFMQLNDMLIFEKKDIGIYTLKYTFRDMKIEFEKKIMGEESGESSGCYIEGMRNVYYTSKYERDPKNRREAIKIHGCTCSVCKFDFEKIYGELGKDFIEIHHKKPLFSLDEAIAVDPKSDLAPVCSNCHRMLHRRRDRIVTIEELQNIINH